MSVPNTYYIDSYEFSTATKIYIDANRTILAPTGWYKFSNTVRYFDNGEFTSSDFCDCVNPCDFIFTTTNENLSVYDATIPVDTAQGAIVFRLSVSQKNAGISATYDSVNYKNTYIPSGMLTTPRDFVLFGEATTSPCPNQLSDNNYTGVYRYVMSGGDFTLQAMNLSFTAYTNQVYVTGLQMGMMIIPKPTPVASTVDIRVYGLCPSFDFFLEGNCVEEPIAIEVYGSVYETESAACAGPLTSPNPLYYIKRDLAASTYDTGDVFFVDPFCETPATEGYYIVGQDGTKNQLIIIGANGVLSGITACK